MNRLLTLRVSARMSCERVRARAFSKKQDIELRIAEFETRRAALDLALANPLAPISLRVEHDAVPTVRRATATVSGVDVAHAIHVASVPSCWSVDSDRVSCYPSSVEEAECTKQRMPTSHREHLRRQV